MNAGWGLLCCCRSCCCSVAWLSVLCRRSSSLPRRSRICCRVFSRIDQLEDHFRCVAIQVSFLLLLIPGSVLRTVVFSVCRFGGDGFWHTYKAFCCLCCCDGFCLLIQFLSLPSFLASPSSIKIQSRVVRQKLKIFKNEFFWVLWMSGWVGGYL